MHLSELFYKIKNQTLTKNSAVITVKQQNYFKKVLA